MSEVRRYSLGVERRGREINCAVLNKTDDGEWIWRQHTWICADSPFIDSIKDIPERLVKVVHDSKRTI